MRGLEACGKSFKSKGEKGVLILKKEIKALIGYIKKAISIEEIEIPELTEEEQKNLYKMSIAQDVAPLVSIGIRKTGSPEWMDQYQKKFMQQEFMAVYRYKNQSRALEEIRELFQENQIFYLPLKGSVLRKYYPEEWMRTSSDIDILINEQYFVCAKDLLIEKCRFTNVSENKKDASFYRDRVVHLELHKNLIKNDTIEDFNPEYIWNNVECDGFECTMKDEDFYAYHLEHMKNHFLNGGCGIRYFLDLWILNHRIGENNRSVRKEKMKRCGLEEFEDAAVHLSEVWFGEEEHNQLTQQMEEYIFKAGIYGSIENWALVQEIQHNGKWKRIWKRLWLPYKQLIWDYPNLKGKQYLQPYYEGKRFIKMITDGRWKRSLRELNSNKEIDEYRKAVTKEMFQKLKIKFFQNNDSHV